MKNWILLGIVCLMTAPVCLAEPGELGEDKTNQCLVPDPNRPGQQMVNCAGFDELRIRCKASKEKEPPYSVSMFHRLVNVPCTGFYIIRYWPKGRHAKLGFFDYLIGDLKAGKNSSGDLDSCIRKGQDLNPCEMEKVKCDENMSGHIDLEVWPNEADYKADKTGAMLGQCDRNCSVKFGCNGDDPCICHVPVNESGDPDPRFKPFTVCDETAAGHLNDHPRDYKGKCK